MTCPECISGNMSLKARRIVNGVLTEWWECSACGHVVKLVMEE